MAMKPCHLCVDARVQPNKVHSKDDKMTAFCSSKGMFCYQVMEFGLKNAGNTCIRAMTVIFKKMLRDMVECYIDN